MDAYLQKTHSSHGRCRAEPRPLRPRFFRIEKSAQGPDALREASFRRSRDCGFSGGLTIDSGDETELRSKVLIIGAGPYGIAVAQELWERGIDFAVIGKPFSLWMDHTLDSMRLRTDTGMSEICSPGSCVSLAEFLMCRGLDANRDPVPVDLFRQYLSYVLEHLPFKVLDGKVRRLEVKTDGFLAHCSEGEKVTASAVVLATGLGPHRHIPSSLVNLPRERTVHSWETHRIEAMRGSRVLVIGNGQSAAETVDHLRSRNQVSWSMRKKPVFRRGPLNAPKALSRFLIENPQGLFKLPPKMRRRVIHQLSRPTVTWILDGVYSDGKVEKIFGHADELGLRGSAGRIAGTADVHFDFVVSATGYNSSLTGLPFLATELARDLWQSPEIDSDFQSSVRNLFAVGALAEKAFGPAMRLIRGSRFAAQRLGRALARL